MAQDETVLNDIIADAERSTDTLRAFFEDNSLLPQEKPDFDKVNERVRSLDPDRLNQLAALLQDQVNAFKRLSLPDAYVDLLNELHARAYAHFRSHPLTQDMLPRWLELAPQFIDMYNGNYITDKFDTEGGWLTRQHRQLEMTPYARKRLDDTGLTFEKCVQLMNIAAQSTKMAWEECLGIIDPLRAQRVIGYKITGPDRKFECSVETDEDKSTYYYVSDHSICALDMRTLIDIGHHEPHHDIQKRMDRLEVNSITRYHEVILWAKQYYKMGCFCPPTVFFGTANLDLEQLAFQSYYLSMSEVPAFHQGNAACLRFGSEFGIPMSEHFRKVLEDYPAHKTILPAELRSNLRNMPEMPSQPRNRMPTISPALGDG